MEYVAFGKTDEAGATAIHWCRVLAVCVLFLWLSSVIIQRERVLAVTSYLADFSFFLFTVHIPAQNALTSRVWVRLFSMRNTFFCLAEYFGAISLGTKVGLALRKVCPCLFRPLNRPTCSFSLNDLSNLNNNFLNTRVPPFPACLPHAEVGRPSSCLSIFCHTSRMLALRGGLCRRA